jgi:hypothetical protein
MAAALFVLIGAAAHAVGAQAESKKSNARQAPRVPEISLQVELKSSDLPLTQEMIWNLAPEVKNPHRRTWIVTRKIDWLGLEPFQIENGRWAARAQGLTAFGQSYVRPEGPWFRPLSEFSCSAEPSEDFTTFEGARKAAEAAAQSWSDTLSAEKVKLSILLGRIAAESAESATLQARIALSVWASAVEAEWRAQGFAKARAAEWRHYLGLARASGICPRAKGKLSPGDRSREARMEQPPVGVAVTPDALGIGDSKDSNILLARAPARRWDGLFSVRVTIEVLGKKVLGQFLIDSGAGASILNPYWLESQGIRPVLIETPDVPPQRVIWTGGSGFARRARVDKATVSSFDIGQREFLLLETELFGPPSEVGTCCDGILGTDFLRKHIVEFEPGQPSGINIWRRLGFHKPGWIWAEASESPQGDLVSECVLTPGSKAKTPILRGVRWDTGSVAGLEIHTPWKPQAAAGAASGWQLDCAGAAVATQLMNGGARLTAFGQEKAGPVGVRFPAVSIGMPMLGRGRFVLDLPHGRIWLDPATLSQPILKNRSGLVVEYFFKKGERLLQVKSIRPGSAADRLTRQGLKPGSLLLKIGSKDVEDLDHWEVERHLAGAYGRDVVLSWKNGNDSRMASLAVP